MKKLTIITVCLNIASTIERTCQSIVNQTFQDFEWIVVDGASTDGTLQILEKYRNRIDILISEPDKGIYNAMNKGIKLASGEYVNFMNGGDEFYDNDVLAKVFNGKEYDADVIYGATYYKDHNKLSISQNIPDKKSFYKCSINHQSAIIKTKYQKKYPFDEKYKVCADYDFFIKLVFSNKKFVTTDIIISTFYSGGYGQINHELGLEENKMIREKYYNFFDKLKYDPIYNEKYNHYKMALTHPRYIAGWIKRKIIK